MRVGVVLSDGLDVDEADAVGESVDVPAEGVDVRGRVPVQERLREGGDEWECVTRCEGEGVGVVLRVSVERVRRDRVAVSVGLPLRAPVRLPVALETLGEWVWGVHEPDGDRLYEADTVAVQARVRVGRLAEGDFVWVVDAEPRVAVADHVQLLDADALGDREALQEALELPLRVAEGDGLADSDAERVKDADQASEVVQEAEPDLTVPDGDTLAERLAVRVDEAVAVSRAVGLGLLEAVKLRLQLAETLSETERDSLRLAVPEAERVGDGDGDGEEVDVVVGVGSSVGDGVLEGDRDWLPVREAEQLPVSEEDRVLLQERVAVPRAE